MIILKVLKNQGFTLCLEDTTFEKPQGGGQPPAVLGLKKKNHSKNYFKKLFNIVIFVKTKISTVEYT